MTNMRKIIQISLFYLLLFYSTSIAFAQEKKSNDPDMQIKETLYAKYKNEVRAFDRRDFDDLFFEYFQKQGDSKLTLTKEEFYTYTIKIAIYSEKLGLLYKDKKEEAQQAKEDWYSKSYSEYLSTKK
jgi:hypothetical protein